MGSREPDQPMRYPQYAQLSKREVTFEQGWPEPLLGKIPDIARAGFYYRGVKDNATCFHCGMTLTNWDLEDNPYAEHAYWNPNCPYINQYKGRSWVMGLNEIYLCKRIKLPDPIGDSILVLLGPRHPKYREFKWKIKYVLAQQREGPESTWIQGKWIEKAGDCIKDYGKKVVPKGYDIKDCACETHYLYMRRSFPIQKELKKSFECLLL
ncbi:baculoviral IAP repeat-containing protein 7-B-like [Saccostrea cucullata]|uniref:baculoviral IAP repeat-containing protein 7-B-like n=1 Tax=Saccostrea cuccullata TaxID=36930 RepID=UPI002ED68882